MWLKNVSTWLFGKAGREENKPMGIMVETVGMINLKKRRERLFLTLDDILCLAEQKRKTVNLTDKTKQSWCRLAISAIDAYGSLLHDCEIQDILERLSTVEKSLGVATS